MGSSQSWERWDCSTAHGPFSILWSLCYLSWGERTLSSLSLLDISLHYILVLFPLLYSLLSFLSIELFIHWVITWYRFTRTRCNRSSIYHILSNQVHRVIKANKNRVPELRRGIRHREGGVGKKSSLEIINKVCYSLHYTWTWICWA